MYLVKTIILANSDLEVQLNHEFRQIHNVIEYFYINIKER